MVKPFLLYFPMFSGGATKKASPSAKSLKNEKETKVSKANQIFNKSSRITWGITKLHQSIIGGQSWPNQGSLRSRHRQVAWGLFPKNEFLHRLVHEIMANIKALVGKKKLYEKIKVQRSSTVNLLNIQASMHSSFEIGHPIIAPNSPERGKKSHYSFFFFESQYHDIIKLEDML